LETRVTGRAQIHNNQVFLKIFGLRHEIAHRVERDAVAVEDQLIISADLVHDDQRRAVALGLRAEQLDAKLRFVHHERRSADVEKHLRAGGVEVGDRIAFVQAPLDQPLVVPEVLANRQTDRLIADAHEVSRLAGDARLEIAALVEHVVRR
jgi:hypothetical protein